MAEYEPVHSSVSAAHQGECSPWGRGTRGKLVPDETGNGEGRQRKGCFRQCKGRTGSESGHKHTHTRIQARVFCLWHQKIFFFSVLPILYMWTIFNDVLSLALDVPPFHSAYTPLPHSPIHHHHTKPMYSISKPQSRKEPPFFTGLALKALGKFRQTTCQPAVTVAFCLRSLPLIGSMNPLRKLLLQEAAHGWGGDTCDTSEAKSALLWSAQAQTVC